MPALSSRARTQEAASIASYYTVLMVCGVIEMTVGVLLMWCLVLSIYDADAFLQSYLKVPAAMIAQDKSAGNSWAQTAVAFGMHAYADIMNGYEQFNIGTQGKTTNEMPSIPKMVSMWNSTRFVISFLWMLQFIRGMSEIHGISTVEKVMNWPLTAQVVVIALLIDSLLVRPFAVYAQRHIDDVRPNKAGLDLADYTKYNTSERCCRFVFYYEGILSGTSGLVYLVFPQLFLWMYKFQNTGFISEWSLCQFGALVSTFGLYQMNAELDTRPGHVFWWLFLDWVWLYVFWVGVTAQLGPWNPLLLQGGNFWTHSAFHADSTLALARSIFLVSRYYSASAAKVDATKSSRKKE